VAEPVTNVRDIAVAELHLWDRNPRRISDAAFASLVKSLEADPSMMQARPIIALPDGRVVAGNMRLRAAIELGWETVPTVYADLDEHRALTWALRDNNPYGEWQELELAELLRELDSVELDLELTGFGREELDRLLADVDGPPADRGKELALADVSIGDPRHTCERGERWRVGRHVLIVDSVYDGWPRWKGELAEGDLFVPYPTPTLPLTERAGRQRLVMVQPDAWLAGHVLDKYASVRGEDELERMKS
jgi:ParB-like nuclease domain